MSDKSFSKSREQDTTWGNIFDVCDADLQGLQESGIHSSQMKAFVVSVWCNVV